MASVKGKVQQFGGDWTADKLERVRKYLAAYMQVMKDRPYECVYIDAFAGTGYVEVEPHEQPLFSAFEEPETQRFLQGSARIALQIEPRFSKFVFIEKSPSRFSELEKLKAEFSCSGHDIVLHNEEANGCLLDLCRRYDWKRTRAVLFLDPFGMAVEWTTVEAIARTKAIDLWYLFPLGVAVNRLLKRDGQIKEPLSHRLDLIFGSHDWYSAFYQAKAEVDLLGETITTGKVADFSEISDYFVHRLRTVFKGGVAEKPLPLYNTCNIPLYLLCFAVGNPRAPSAAKIARHILRQ